MLAKPKLLSVIIELENDCFAENLESEVATILTDLAHRIQYEGAGLEEHKLHDINGNRVGCVQLFYP
jgi:hypothetical protein